MNVAPEKPQTAAAGALMSVCRRHLALVWFAAAGLLLVLVLLQSLLGHYGAHVREAWSWLLPTIMPTLALIIGVLTADLRAGRDDPPVDPFLYRLALGASVFYLLVVALTIFVQPLVAQAPTELMSMSNLWLAPLQGLVSAAIGAFFVKKV